MGFSSMKEKVSTPKISSAKSKLRILKSCILGINAVIKYFFINGSGGFNAGLQRNGINFHNVSCS